MKVKEKPSFPLLEDLLSISLFSESSLTEGFSDKKALAVIDTCRSHLGIDQGARINSLIKNILIESLGRNAGSGENYGFGYPHDVIEKTENRLETEINEELIYEIIDWAYSISDHELVTISKNKEEEYFFQSIKDPRELISYQTMSNLAFKGIESCFKLEYERLSHSISQIPKETWDGILGKDDSIDKYL